jgi:hypothetical protein
LEYEYNHPVMEKQIATLREDLASRDERIATLEKLLQQQQGLGRGGI